MTFLNGLAFTWCLASLSGIPDEIENPSVSVAMETIDAEDVYAYIDLMASDELFGRNAGTRGNDMAAEWIAEFFQRCGLKPGGDDGTYFQHFTFHARGTKGEKTQTQNVVGIWEGTDPALKGEALVVGAHFDHVGFKGQKSNPGRLGRAKEDDRIWNGADDNASGTAAVLEIAQAFSFLRLKTRRTIIFILFSAEEHGLYGSWYYVNNPLVSLEDTVAMLNLDMVGRNTKSPVYATGTDSSAESFFEDLLEKCSKRIADFNLKTTPLAFGGSDHGPFLSKQIPALFFFSGLHRDYHQVSDEVEKIDCDRVARVAKCAFLMLQAMADCDERVTWNQTYRSGSKGEARRRLLGINVGKRVEPRELEGLGFPEIQGAVRVDNVYQNTPAWKAGLKQSDLILGIDKVRIQAKRTSTSLREAIESAPPNTEVVLEVLRKGEVLVLSVKWEEEGKPRGNGKKAQDR